MWTHHFIGDIACLRYRCQICHEENIVIVLWATTMKQTQGNSAHCHTWSSACESSVLHTCSRLHRLCTSRKIA